MNTKNTDTTISLAVDGIWAGSGKLIGGNIRDCGAVFCDDQDESETVYEMIEEAIAAGKQSLKIELSDRSVAAKITWDIVEPEYRIAFPMESGEWDVVEAFTAESNDDANEYAEKNYADKEWFVLDACGKNINGGE